jgi:putative PIN family toxin of toxin-antitoxin system
MSAKPKVVLDTTVLISAFLTSGGTAAELLSRAGIHVTLVLAPEILGEMTRKLLGKKKIRKSYVYSDGDVYEYLSYLTELTGVMVYTPEPLLGVVRHPEDDMIVACAVAAGSDYIVSRDRDLLDLGAHKDITILTPRQLLDILPTA